MDNDHRDIIVIGASAGGIEPLCAITSLWPPDLPAAIFVVVHVPAWRDSHLAAIVSRCSPLRSLNPKSGEKVEHGRIYIAPPDQHLLIDGGDRIELWRGPKENNFRPSINALFRSAAVSYGARVTGVVLSGVMDDGATGLRWIKQMNGVAIVQKPTDARFSQMPQTAISNVSVDYIATAAEIGQIVADLARGTRPPGKGVDQGIPS